MDPQWLDWAKRLQAIAQIGLTYNENPYDVERYEAARQIAAEIMAGGAPGLARQFGDLFRRQDGYATPRVDVRGVVFKDDAVLLVKEHEDGRWTLPGGWADVGQSGAESVVREIYEESGYRTRALKLLAVYDRARHPHEPPFPFHIYKMFFLCELIGGEPTLSHETDAIGFFHEDELPELSISRLTLGQLRRMFAHHRNPGWPTDFD